MQKRTLTSLQITKVALSVAAGIVVPHMRFSSKNSGKGYIVKAAALVSMFAVWGDGGPMQSTMLSLILAEAAAATATYRRQKCLFQSGRY
jgi:hypothetical protein